MTKDTFDLGAFLPYLLNQAAESVSREFSGIYKQRYGMTRAQWRVMANLGKFGAMTATEICNVSQIEKTMVSRAVQALEDKGWLTRESVASDRRSETLSLTQAGETIYADLGQAALHYNAKIREKLGAEATKDMVALLRRLIETEPAPKA